MKRWMIAAVACIALAGSANAYTCDCRSGWLGVSLSPDQAALLGVLEEYISLRVDGDHENWIALWDEAGVDMPYDAPMCVGKAEILSAGRAGGARELVGMRLASQEICLSECFGFILGRYFYAREPLAPGSEPKYEGKFLTILRRQDDGRWLLYRNCFNRDAPAM